MLQANKLLPNFLLSWYHFFLAVLAAFLYRFPSRHLIIIGVTGTNGKSTTVHMLSRILEHCLGQKVASISSLRFKIGNKERKNTLKMTMPGRLKLRKFLRAAIDDGCKYAVIEVTSQGLVQHRAWGIKFDTAVLTNLTPEHIESHGSFENYKRAKLKLFKQAKNGVINLDDKNSSDFIGVNKVFGYSHKDIRNLNLKLKLAGEFMRYNAMAAIKAAQIYGVAPGAAQAVVESIENIPGRMEVVVEHPFKVIVDYAHTPDALEKVYKTIKNLQPILPTIGRGLVPKMICVLGACGGGRDKWKRVELGKLAARYCKEIILTNEDPYEEDPMGILKEIVKGIKTYYLKPNTYRLILDRRRAIRKSLKMARPGDSVIITGKGAEPWICIAGGKKIPWDDRKVARQEFKKIFKPSP